MIPTDILQWGAAVILALQSLSNPALDTLVRAFNFLGTEEFYMIALGAFFWCIHKQVALALVPTFLLADYASRVLKALTNVPRPYDFNSSIRNMDPQLDTSFPSAAVQGSTGFWGYLAARFNKAWLWALAVVAVALVGFSRMYLGVHYPTDVLGGIFFGALVVVILLRVDFYALARRLYSPWGLAITAVPLILVIGYLNTYTATTMGMLLGFVIGVAFEEKFFPFQTQGQLWQQVAKIVLGFFIVLALRFGLKAIFPGTDAFQFVRYAILGVATSAGAPWLFIQMQLAAREQPTKTEAAPAPVTP